MVGRPSSLALLLATLLLVAAHGLTWGGNCSTAEEKCSEQDNMCQVRCEILQSNTQDVDPRVNCTHRCTYDRKKDRCGKVECSDLESNRTNCMQCNCFEQNCAANSSLLYAAARLDHAILQDDDLALYRFSIHKQFDSIGSPERYALNHTALRSNDFNPRIRAKRPLFTHVLKMSLVLACIYITVHFLYGPLNKLIEKGTGKKKKSSAPRARHVSKEIAGSAEDEKIEEYLKDENMLFNWYHPQQLLTPVACFPKGFPVHEAAIQGIDEKPVRCNQSKEYLTMAA